VTLELKDSVLSTKRLPLFAHNNIAYCIQQYYTRQYYT